MDSFGDDTRLDLLPLKVVIGRSLERRIGWVDTENPIKRRMTYVKCMSTIDVVCIGAAFDASGQVIPVHPDHFKYQAVHRPSRLNHPK